MHRYVLGRTDNPLPNVGLPAEAPNQQQLEYWVEVSGQLRAGDTQCLALLHMPPLTHLHWHVKQRVYPCQHKVCLLVWFACLLSMRPERGGVRGRAAHGLRGGVPAAAAAAAYMLCCQMSMSVAWLMLYSA